MGKQTSAAMGSFFHELFQVGLYKRSQGRITRQATFGVLAVAGLFGSFRLYQFLITSLDSGPRYAVATTVAAVALWLSYRLVNYPQFADFLIAVEAEMNKVTWPTRNELIRSSIVVILVIIFLAALLFCFDFIWQVIFQFLGIIQR